MVVVIETGSVSCESRNYLSFQKDGRGSLLAGDYGKGWKGVAAGVGGSIAAVDRGAIAPVAVHSSIHYFVDDGVKDRV